MVKFDMPMPESCFWDCWLTDRIVCFATPEGRYLEDVDEFDKPAWCPLKECAPYDPYEMRWKEVGTTVTE